MEKYKMCPTATEATSEDKSSVLDSFAKEALAEYRKKLLDLKFTNPLLNFKHSSRGRAIRVIDEVPDELYQRLIEKNMRFKPLPKLGKIPNDEKSEEFKRKLTELEETDKEYNEEIEKLSADKIGEEKKQKLDWDLRDKVREELGLHPVGREKIDLSAHAKSENYNPDYNLPFESDNPLHTDNRIQTLLLQDDLKKQEKKLQHDYRSSIDEMGVNTLNAAFGFIEWFESASSDKKRLSPLLLLPLTIKKTAQGLAVSAEGEGCMVNTSLKVRMKNDFGFDLPDFDSEARESGVIENYFREIEKIIENFSRWKVRRFVTFGQFRPQKIALYEDLDLENWPNPKKLLAHKNIASILAAPDDGGASGDRLESIPSGPKFRKKYPAVTVFQADSSQYQAIKESLSEENLVIQGPPGTGKSQTIGNIIASFIAADKKVLFIAEKKAALDVVSSRLRDCGLGPLLLEFQKGRNRQEMLKNLHERLDCEEPIERLEREIENMEDQMDKMKSSMDNFEVKNKNYYDKVHASSGFCEETFYAFIGAYLKVKGKIEKIDEEDVLDEINIESSEQLEEYKKLLTDYVASIQNLDSFDCKYEFSWLGRNENILDDFIRKAKKICAEIETNRAKYEQLTDMRVRLGSSAVFCNSLKQKTQAMLTKFSKESYLQNAPVEFWHNPDEKTWYAPDGKPKTIGAIYEMLGDAVILGVDGLMDLIEKQEFWNKILAAKLDKFCENNKSLSSEEIVAKFEFHIRHKFFSDNRGKFKIEGIVEEDRENFRKLHKNKMSAEAAYVLKKGLNKEIPEGNSRGRPATYSQRFLIEQEIKKQKAHIPTRKLVRNARNALFSMKPVWMMTPLVVPEYLPREANLFDVVIIDEASQMFPEDALSAIVRAEQLIVVGDNKQLPPTNFFKGTRDSSEEEEEIITDLESILDLADLRFRNNKMLTRHYRSRCPSLIKFSNEKFYKNELVIPPRPADDSDIGIEHIKIEGRLQGKGSNRLNIEEARQVVDKAKEIMYQYPDKSLAIVTMNQKQRDLVLAEMDQMADSDGTVSDYINQWDEKLERFIVKNLENIQGDERDIVIVSTVYAPDEYGEPVKQRFGPINGIYGHRRLNVLFTRAKEKLILITSLNVNDITPTDRSHKGVTILRDYLGYAKNGKIEEGLSKGEYDSDFEEQVADALRDVGFKVDPQIGVDGFRIDLGIKHEKYPDGYLAGVECDGASYHSSYSARERDIRRQAILESRGWKIFRVWSTDWFDRPRAETKKLKQSLYDYLDEKTANS